MWEDEANKFGGRFTLRMNKGFANQLWEDLILAFIGEQFEVENEITGIIISVKQNYDSIQLWNRNSRDRNIVESIKNDLYKVLSLGPEIKVDYAEFYPEKPAEP